MPFPSLSLNLTHQINCFRLSPIQCMPCDVISLSLLALLVAIFIDRDTQYFGLNVEIGLEDYAFDALTGIKQKVKRD